MEGLQLFCSWSDCITVERVAGWRVIDKKPEEILMTLPSHAHFLLFCEEGFLFGMFLSGERLNTFLDFDLVTVAKIYLNRVYCEETNSVTIVRM